MQFIVLKNILLLINANRHKFNLCSYPFTHFYTRRNEIQNRKDVFKVKDSNQVVGNRGEWIKYKLKKKRSANWWLQNSRGALSTAQGRQSVML